MLVIERTWARFDGNVWGCVERRNPLDIGPVNQFCQGAQ